MDDQSYDRGYGKVIELIVLTVLGKVVEEDRGALQSFEVGSPGGS